MQELMKWRDFPQGMTVKDLKEVLKDWPEENEDGEPTEVWISTERGVSNPVYEVWPLNRRENEEGLSWADLSLERGD